MWPQDLNTDFALQVCLFEAVRSSKNADPDEYSYYLYGIGLDSCSLFHIQVLIGVKMLLFLE